MRTYGIVTYYFLNCDNEVRTTDEAYYPREIRVDFDDECYYCKIDRIPSDEFLLNSSKGMDI